MNILRIFIFQKIIYGSQEGEKHHLAESIFGFL